MCIKKKLGERLRKSDQTRGSNKNFRLRLPRSCRSLSVQILKIKNRTINRLLRPSAVVTQLRQWSNQANTDRPKGWAKGWGFICSEGIHSLASRGGGRTRSSRRANLKHRKGKLNYGKEIKISKRRWTLNLTAMFSISIRIYSLKPKLLNRLLSKRKSNKYLSRLRPIS